MKGFYKILSLMLFLLLCSSCSKTILEINGERVHKNIYDWEINKRLRQHAGKNVAIENDLLRESALTAIINRKLIVQEARKKDIGPTQKEFSDRWEQFVATIKNDGFQAFLKINNVSERDLKKLIIEALVSEKFYKSLFDSFDISGDEVKRYYLSQNWQHLGPIKIKTAVIKTASKREAGRIFTEIERSAFDTVFWNLRRQQKPGVDLTEPSWMYQELSDGDLYKEADKINIGKYKGPLRIGEAWYIIKVYSRQAEMPGFEEIKDQLRVSMKKQRTDKELESLLKERFAASDVKIYKERL